MGDNEKNMFYSRLNSFGEYKYHNRLDTVFVLQLSFILMLVYICLHYLHKYGLFSTYGYYLVILLLVLIFILIVLNRAFVLPKFRSTSNWNQYKFDRLNPPPDISGNSIKRVGVEGGTVGSSSPNSASCNT